MLSVEIYLLIYIMLAFGFCLGLAVAILFGCTKEGCEKESYNCKTNSFGFNSKTRTKGTTDEH